MLVCWIYFIHIKISTNSSTIIINLMSYITKMASDDKFMEYFYRIFLPNISQNVSFKKILKVVNILHLLPFWALGADAGGAQ